MGRTEYAQRLASGAVHNATNGENRKPLKSRYPGIYNKSIVAKTASSICIHTASSTQLDVRVQSTPKPGHPSHGNLDQKGYSPLDHEPKGSTPFGPS